MYPEMLKDDEKENERLKNVEEYKGKVLNKKCGGKRCPIKKNKRRR